MLEYTHDLSLTTYLFRIDEEGILRYNAVLDHTQKYTEIPSDDEEEWEYVRYLYGHDDSNPSTINPSTSNYAYRVDEEGNLRDNRALDFSHKFIEISSARYHSVALSDTGEVYGHGTNTCQQLASFISVPYTITFVPLHLPVPAVTVIAFGESTAALDNKGKVWCRGKIVETLEGWNILPLHAAVTRIWLKEEKLFFEFK